jgi:hypothetical protein
VLKSCDETVCWLVRHAGAVLSVEALIARVVDRAHNVDGVSMNVAHSLMQPPRVAWFDVEVNGRRTLLRVNAGAETYHERLVATKRCRCPRKLTTI